MEQPTEAHVNPTPGEILAVLGAPGEREIDPKTGFPGAGTSAIADVLVARPELLGLGTNSEESLSGALNDAGRADSKPRVKQRPKSSRQRAKQTSPDASSSTKTREDHVADESEQVAAPPRVTRPVEPELRSLAQHVMNAFKGGTVAPLRSHYPSDSDARYMLALRLAGLPDISDEQRKRFEQSASTLPRDGKREIEGQFAKVRRQCEQAGVQWSSAKLESIKTASEVDWGITKGHLVMTIVSGDRRFSITVEDARMTPDRLIMGALESCVPL